MREGRRIPRPSACCAAQRAAFLSVFAQAGGFNHKNRPNRPAATKTADGGIRNTKESAPAGQAPSEAETAACRHNTKGIFKGKERKALTEQIRRTEKEIAEKPDKPPDVLKEDGYPDVQFMATCRKAEAVGEQYDRELAEWERKAGEKQKPAEKEQTAPPGGKAC